MPLFTIVQTIIIRSLHTYITYRIAM